MISHFERVIMGCASTLNNHDNTNNQLPSGGDMAVVSDELLCNGRGECDNGTCICEIRYSGDECRAFNLPYHAGISSVFYCVALFSLIQLMICIVAEYQRLKRPSIVRACRITAQKLLYFIVFLAALLRGAYFTTPVSIFSTLFITGRPLVDSKGHNWLKMTLSSLGRAIFDSNGPFLDRNWP